MLHNKLMTPYCVIYFLGIEGGQLPDFLKEDEDFLTAAESDL